MGKEPGTLGIIEACKVHGDLLITIPSRSPR
jgi:hypothetical protein